MRSLPPHPGFSALNHGTTWTTETDTMDGYRPVLRGPQPEFPAYGSWQDELDGILRQVQERTGGDSSIAVSVPSKKQVEQVESYLTAHGERGDRQRQALRPPGVVFLAVVTASTG
jgi:hypothetical protein